MFPLVLDVLLYIYISTRYLFFAFAGGVTFLWCIWTGAVLFFFSRSKIWNFDNYIVKQSVRLSTCGVFFYIFGVGNIILYVDLCIYSSSFSRLHPLVIPKYPLKYVSPPGCVPRASSRRCFPLSRKDFEIANYHALRGGMRL